MSFSTQLTTDLDVFLNTAEYAKSITYAGEAINAIVILDDLTPALGPDSFQGKIYVKVSDLSSVPSYQDTVVIDGETWTVFRDQDDAAYYISEGMYIINIIKAERPRFG